MLFLALRFFEKPTLSCAALCFFESQSSFCAALCFFEKPKLFLALLSALSQSFFLRCALL